uniref:Uncharacterized protein n=1 Tax=Meloidogyne incognita TaxID=6306 RepID=A0A914LHI6_MELIC
MPTYQSSLIIPTIPCAECNNVTLCNTEMFFEKQVFCLEKLANETKIIKGAKICREECFVSRDFATGNVTQGCGNCSIEDKTECITCKKGHYCNSEDKVYKHCWTDKNKICKTKFNDACYTWRTLTNEVKKGCGKCSFHTCEECEGHRCNIEIKPPFYCFGFLGSYNKCNKSDCYIAKIEEKNGDEKINQFHYDCGKCPSGILNLSPYIMTKDTTLQNKIKKINMSNVQCAECSKKPACNADTFFESQLFCWEKDFKEWTATKGKRVCTKGLCFVGIYKGEKVQGCGKCSDEQNLSKCFNCSNPLCNDETKLSQIKCYHLTTNQRPNERKAKTCHPSYDSCYVARDIFWRTKQNCGECPFKFKYCIKCNHTDLCNEDSLLPLSATTAETKTVSRVYSATTSVLTKKEPTIFIKDTTHRFSQISSAQINKNDNNMLTLTLLTLIIYFIY